MASSGKEGSSSPDLTTIEEGDVFGKVPLKVVTGRQLTTGLSFDLKPGAIVAHTNSRVIFVCG